LVASPTSKKVLQFAGVEDVYTATTGSTKTKGNFAKAVFYALQSTFHFLTPDLWGKLKKKKKNDNKQFIKKLTF
jgi:small subunit ribosomal protein S2e